MLHPNVPINQNTALKIRFTALGNYVTGMNFGPRKALFVCGYVLLATSVKQRQCQVVTGYIYAVKLGQAILVAGFFTNLAGYSVERK